jgi:hypothetical protein
MGKIDDSAVGLAATRLGTRDGIAKGLMDERYNADERFAEILGEQEGCSLFRVRRTLHPLTCQGAS